MEINSCRLISLSEQPGIGIDSQLHRRLLYPATRKIDGNSFGNQIFQNQESQRDVILVTGCRGGRGDGEILIKGILHFLFTSILLVTYEN